MIINDLDGYYIVFDTKNRNTELDTLLNNIFNKPNKKLTLWQKIIWLRQAIPDSLNENTI
jgi:hypothetical protein